MKIKTEKMTHLPKLTPITSPWMEQLLLKKDLLFNLFKKYESPINIHHMESFKENHREFKNVLDHYGLDHQIYFARKANKCKALVEAARDMKIGVDTASFNELHECIELGVNPSQIVITAAVKNEKILRYAVTKGVDIMLDNEDECKLLNDIAFEMNTSVSVGIRVGGFRYNGSKLYTRFGFDIDYVLELITKKIGKNNKYENLEFKGFHFHLNGYSRQERSEALLQTLSLAKLLNTHGISTDFIDIGGGFLVNYLKNKDDWNEFFNELQLAVMGLRSPITFNNNGLGYEIISNELHGKPNVYPYFNKTSKDKFLKEVLTYEKDPSRNIVNELKNLNVQLRIEPGRSMLSQVGITIAEVAYRKYDSSNNLLIGIEMNRTQLFSSSADFLLDPIVIYKNNPDKNSEEVPVFFTGAYCLEQDIILKRKIMLPKMPEVGDVVCFFNTAGYMMHFYESEAHKFNLATNLIIHEKDDNFYFRADNNSIFVNRIEN